MLPDLTPGSADTPSVAYLKRFKHLLHQLGIERIRVVEIVLCTGAKHTASQPISPASKVWSKSSIAGRDGQDGAFAKVKG